MLCNDQPPPPRIVAAVSPYDPGEIELAVANRYDYGPGAQYTWDFGDGASEPTAYPYARHRFLEQLGPTELSRNFDVQVHITYDGKQADGTKTITV